MKVEKNIGYKDYVEISEENKCYLEHIAGDTSRFRYPHLISMEDWFVFDEDHKYWRFFPENAPGAFQEEAADKARRFAMEDITVWEFLSPAAKQLHFYDMAGRPYPDGDRQKAFEEVCRMYGERNQSFPGAELVTMKLKDLRVRKGFGYIRELYRQIEDLPVHFLRLKETGLFPFGSVLKGTDLVVTDESPFNFCQDMLHALYHFKEGIPGRMDDNLMVEEIWAGVPALYALQLARGRMARRRRRSPSPHLIRFTDYIYLRAYLGQAFAGEKDFSEGHPVFSLIEPAIRLMIYPLRNKSEEERNRILADAVLEDRTQELVSCFEGALGKGSFNEIYGTWSIYDKYENALSYLAPGKLDEIMFEGPALLPTGVDSGIVKQIWKEIDRRDENITLLSSGK